MYFKVSPYQEVLEGIVSALQFNEGILKVTGRQGTGKTALCNQLFRHLEGKKQKTLLFLQTPTSVASLQNQILEFLNLDTAGNFTRTLTSYLLAKPVEQRLLYLIVDDAQQLDEQTFTAIRMLCNIQDDHNALVKPVIFGTPVLDEKLAAANFRSVGQYISQSLSLPPMTAEQMKNFYWTYWVSQGVQIQPPSDKLINGIYKQTHGFPGAVLEQLKLTQSKQAEKPRPVTKAVDYMPPRTVQSTSYVPLISSKPALKNRDQYYLAGFLGILLLSIGAGMYYLNQKVNTPTQLQLSMAARAASYVPTPLTDTAATPAVQKPELPIAATSDNSEIDVPEETQLVEEVTNLEAEAFSEPTNKELIREEVVAIADTTEAEVVAEVDTRAAEEAPNTSSTQSTIASVSTISTQNTIPSANTSEPASSQADTSTINILPAALTELLANWSSSWQQQDIDGYLAFYHPDFSSSSADNLAQWQSQRRSSIGRASDIRISYDRVEIMDESPNTMTVRFWLNYQASNYGDSTLKELLLENTAGTWLIRSETNLQVEPLQ